MSRLVVRSELCSGCRACQVACVARHDGLFGVHTARLRIVKDDRQGLDEPQVCRQCGRAPCVDACPTGALYRADTTTAVLLNARDCDGCGRCLEACPLHMIALHPRTGLPLICDLCGGEPACAKRCPTGALSYVDAAQERATPPAMHLVRPGSSTFAPHLGGGTEDTGDGGSRV